MGQALHADAAATSATGAWGDAAASGDAPASAVGDVTGLLCEPVVLGLLDGADVEEHVAVREAAELGALAAVDAGLLDGDLELVDATGDDVALEEEGGHVEGMDDVGRGERKRTGSSTGTTVLAGSRASLLQGEASSGIRPSWTMLMPLPG